MSDTAGRKRQIEFRNNSEGHSVIYATDNLGPLLQWDVLQYGGKDWGTVMSVNEASVGPVTMQIGTDRGGFVFKTE